MLHHDLKLLSVTQWILTLLLFHVDPKPLASDPKVLSITQWILTLLLFHMDTKQAHDHKPSPAHPILDQVLATMKKVPYVPPLNAHNLLPNCF